MSYGQIPNNQPTRLVVEIESPPPIPENFAVDEWAFNNIQLCTPAPASTRDVVTINTGTNQLEVEPYGITPPGAIMQYAASASPLGWLLCDGTAVSRVTYARLFAVIGTTYGVGNGFTTFNVPNLQGRVPVGLNPVDPTFNTLNNVGGEKTHILTVNELATHVHTGTTDSAGDHTHAITDPGHSHTYLGVQSQGAASGGDNVAENNPRPTEITSSNVTGITVNDAGTHTHTFTTDQTGSSDPHNNLQPYIVLNYIIKL